MLSAALLTSSSFRIWNSSTGIPSPPLALSMLPQAHLTLLSRMSGSRWVITPSWLPGSLRRFWHSSVYSCNLSISSAFIMTLPFLFYCARLCMKYSLGISNFLEETSSLWHSIVFLYFFVHFRRVSYLSLLFFRALHSVGYTFPFLLYVLLLFFSQLFLRPPQTINLPSCISFSWAWFWSSPHIQCYETPSIVLQVLYQIYSLESVSLLLYNHNKGFDLDTWMA